MTESEATVAQDAQEPSRRDLQKAALTSAAQTVERFDALGGWGAEDVDALTELQGTVVDSLRAVVTAFGPRLKDGPKERVTLEKADPADVAAFFASTGLTRKEIAAAAEVSTSVIATVQNENGDRWSSVTFEAKRAKILAWMETHAAEIKARQDADAAVEAERKAKADAKAQRAATKAQPKPAAAPKASAKAAATSGKGAGTTPAKKTGRPDKAARQANRKPTTSQAAAAAPA